VSGAMTAKKSDPAVPPSATTHAATISTRMPDQRIDLVDDLSFGYDRAVRLSGREAPPVCVSGSFGDRVAPAQEPWDEEGDS
jgi:hypothetical protein